MEIKPYRHVGITALVFLLRQEFVNSAVLLLGNPSKLQNFLDHPHNSVDVFGTRFAHSKCKLLDWPKNELRSCGKQILEMERFTYLDSLISSVGPISDEVSSSIQKGPLVFSNLRHL